MAEIETKEIPTIKKEEQQVLQEVKGELYDTQSNRIYLPSVKRYVTYEPDKRTQLVDNEGNMYYVTHEQLRYLYTISPEGKLEKYRENAIVEEKIKPSVVDNVEFVPRKQFVSYRAEILIHGIKTSVIGRSVVSTGQMTVKGAHLAAKKDLCYKLQNEGYKHPTIYITKTSSEEKVDEYLDWVDDQKNIENIEQIDNKVIIS